MMASARDTGTRKADEILARIRSSDRGVRIGLFYGISRFASFVAAVVLFDLRTFHQERLPEHGAFLMAVNHQSLLDPWIVGASINRRLCYLARESLFESPVLGWLLPRYDTVPVPRDAAAPRRALQVCERILKKGRALVIFPEGTRSPDGRLQPLKRGILFLVRRTGVPVLPVLVHGSFRAWPRHRKLPRPGSVRVNFGEPLVKEDKESSDAFMGRLSAAYRQLALEAGVPEMIPENESGSGAKAGSRSAPALTASGKSASPS